MKLFITGTDTDIGKTYVSVGLLKGYRALGLSTLGIKLVASGCERMGDQYYSQDAKALQSVSSVQLPYHQINPFAFGPAIAPHLAAAEVGSELSVAALTAHLASLPPSLADITLLEGAGGSHIPLNHHETMADFLREAALEVLLVVGLRLGCLNHAILTWRTLRAEGIRVIGWVVNCIDPTMPYQTDNINTLKQHLPIPYLGCVPHHKENQPLTDIARRTLVVL
jgi:dethiobiotin synthetase